MSKAFNNLNELQKYLEKHIEVNLEKIGNEVKSVLRKFILDDLYRSYTPSEYDRTNQFLEAVDVKPVKKSGNTFQVEIFINPDKIQPEVRPYGEWSAHASSLGKWYGNTSWGFRTISEWLIYWLETGDNDSPFFRGKVGMIESTREWLKDDNYVYNTLKARFEQAGFTVV